MWSYEKRLQFPVHITKTCPKTASLLMSQFGGPDGELSASMRYLSQRYTMPCGFDAYYVDHTSALWPAAAAGVPFNACEFQSKGDAIADLMEDLAAEQKARTTYDNLIRIIDDPEVRNPLKFLRAREVVHFQRFGEAMEKIKDSLDAKNFYYFNPEFDKQFVKE